MQLDSLVARPPPKRIGLTAVVPILHPNWCHSSLSRPARSRGCGPRRTMMDSFLIRKLNPLPFFNVYQQKYIMCIQHSQSHQFQSQRYRPPSSRHLFHTAGFRSCAIIPVPFGNSAAEESEAPPFLRLPPASLPAKVVAKGVEIALEQAGESPSRSRNFLDRCFFFSRLLPPPILLSRASSRRVGEGPSPSTLSFAFHFLPFCAFHCAQFFQDGRRPRSLRYLSVRLHVPMGAPSASSSIWPHIPDLCQWHLHVNMAIQARDRVPVLDTITSRIWQFMG